MLSIFTEYKIITVWATLSILLYICSPPPLMFLSTDSPFKKRVGLVTIDFLYIIFTYQRIIISIIRIISRSVLGLATDSPCGVWAVDWMNHLPSVRWSTCLLCGAFQVYVSKWELVCEFWYHGEEFLINGLLLILSLCITNHFSSHIIFYSDELFYTEYCALSYYIDV